MTKHRKPDEPDDEPKAKPRQIEPAWSEDDAWGATAAPKPRAATPAEPAPPKRTANDVTDDMIAEISGLSRHSPSGVETAASRLMALVAELRALP